MPRPTITMKTPRIDVLRRYPRIHEGYMSHYSNGALPLVRAVVAQGDQPAGMLAAWF